MKKSKLILSLTSLALAGTMCVNLSACATSAGALDLMNGIQSKTVQGKATDDKFTSAYSDFAARLFNTSDDKDGNSLISPLSVMLALAMTANGADGETKAEMEKGLGADIPLDDLNEYLYAYISSLPSSDEYKVKTANSIWYRNDGSLAVKQDFLQKNADYYGADVFNAPFDSQTVKDINNWVSKHTDGMIDKMLDEISTDSVMYLINALVFDALWDNEYDSISVSDGKFTGFDGIESTVRMMGSLESKYLEDNSCTGFVKDYKDGKYSFAALLPNSGTEINSFVSSLTGERISGILKSAQDCAVEATLPKFSFDYELSLNDALKELGIKSAFDPDNADFSNMTESASGNVYIGNVLHKTHITVSEKGTKAAAATDVEMKATGAFADEIKSVELDRPFVFMIIDNSSSLPVFIGAVRYIDEVSNIEG
ncbi:MAG: serpin family protein [Acutalibacteraceae bacterium]